LEISFIDLNFKLTSKRTSKKKKYLIKQFLKGEEIIISNYKLKLKAFNKINISYPKSFKGLSNISSYRNIPYLFEISDERYYQIIISPIPTVYLKLRKFNGLPLRGKQFVRYPRLKCPLILSLDELLEREFKKNVGLPNQIKKFLENLREFIIHATNKEDTQGV